MFKPMKKMFFKETDSLKKKNVTNHPKPKLRTFEFYLERQANIELVKLGNRHRKCNVQII